LFVLGCCLRDSLLLLRSFDSLLLLLLRYFRSDLFLTFVVRSFPLGYVSVTLFSLFGCSRWICVDWIVLVRFRCFPVSLFLLPYCSFRSCLSRFGCSLFVVPTFLPLEFVQTFLVGAGGVAVGVDHEFLNRCVPCVGVSHCIAYYRYILLECFVYCYLLICSLFLFDFVDVVVFTLLLYLFLPIHLFVVIPLLFCCSHCCCCCCLGVFFFFFSCCTLL